MTPPLWAKCVSVSMCEQMHVCLCMYESKAFVSCVDVLSQYRPLFKPRATVEIMKCKKFVFDFWISVEIQSLLCDLMRFCPSRASVHLTAATARAWAEETAWAGTEETLRGNGAAPQRGGEEACRERTGSYICFYILNRYRYVDRQYSAIAMCNLMMQTLKLEY